MITAAVGHNRDTQRKELANGLTSTGILSSLIGVRQGTYPHCDVQVSFWPAAASLGRLRNMWALHTATSRCSK